MSKLQNNFTQVPNSLIYTKMPLSALRVMLYLLTYQHREDIYPSLTKIALDCDIDISSVKRGLKHLSFKNFITIKKNNKDHRSYSYTINFEQIDGDCVLSPEEYELRNLSLQVERNKERAKELENKIIQKKNENKESSVTL